MELELPDAGGVTWSVCVRDGSGMPLGAVGADLPLRTASVGKVLLLVETARLITAGELSPDEPLTRSVDLWVGDSGLWHTLSVETLPLIDVAALVGAVSDNLATNVLLRRAGLAEVAARATPAPARRRGRRRRRRRCPAGPGTAPPARGASRGRVRICGLTAAAARK